MKDPAVLFYTSDFIAGTITMTDEQRGKYIILLCLQHQQGLLSYDDMINICKTYDEKIFKKFTKNESGCYYNERMKIESDRRKKYSESRSKNRGNICKTYDKHMGTETENRIEYDNIIENYHSLCSKLSKVQALNETRKGFINARVSEFGLPKLIEVFRKAGESDFLNGVNDKAWKADFEWIIRPNNFIKIMEGKYDNKVKISSNEQFEKEVWSKMKYGNKE